MLKKSKCSVFYISCQLYNVSVKATLTKHCHVRKRDKSSVVLLFSVSSTSDRYIQIFRYSIEFTDSQRNMFVRKRKYKHKRVCRSIPEFNIASPAADSRGTLWHLLMAELQINVMNLFRVRVSRLENEICCKKSKEVRLVRIILLFKTFVTWSCHALFLSIL